MLFNTVARFAAPGRKLPEQNVRIIKDDARVMWDEAHRHAIRARKMRFQKKTGDACGGDHTHGRTKDNLMDDKMRINNKSAEEKVDTHETKINSEGDTKKLN